MFGPVPALSAWWACAGGRALTFGMFLTRVYIYIFFTFAVSDENGVKVVSVFPAVRTVKDLWTLPVDALKEILFFCYTTKCTPCVNVLGERSRKEEDLFCV